MTPLEAIEANHKIIMALYLVAFNSGDTKTQDEMRTELTRLFHMRMAILIKQAQS